MTNERSATCNRLQSPLLRLPGEIRNRIYALAFTVQHVQVIQRVWSIPTSFMYVVFPDDWRGIERSQVYPLSELISSTTVCRQFYAEASPLIPRLNEFCFISTDRRWTEHMPQKFLQAIETIKLISCALETLEEMQQLVDITLSRLGGLRKIVVKATLANFGYVLHEREVREKTFLEVLRKRGFGCEVVFEYQVRR
jgi:hypothetical protein